MVYAGVFLMLTYKRKLKLDKYQEAILTSWIDTCRFVYNMALEIRKASWNSLQKGVNKFDLMNQLPDLKKDNAWIADVPGQTLQEPIERLDKAYVRFFKTHHSGGRHPRFASKHKYKSIVFKQVLKIKDNKIKLTKIGWLKMFNDSEILGRPVRVTVKKEITGFFIYIVCDDIKKNIANKNKKNVCGIDVGVARFCSDSNGGFIDNPKHFEKHERKLRIENRSLARKKKGSKRWEKQRRKLARLHHKIANIRKDFLHKESTKLAKKYHTIYLEDLKIDNMVKRVKPKQDETGKYIRNGAEAKSGLTRSILDCGWGAFRTMLEYKTNVIRVNPKFTSQICSECGHKDAKSRENQSTFKCTSCGFECNADTNAAKNIKSQGVALNRKRSAIAQALVV